MFDSEERINYASEFGGYLDVCKYCHLGNLQWVETPNGWRLKDKEGNIHVCQKPKDYDPYEKYRDMVDDRPECD